MAQTETTERSETTEFTEIPNLAKASEPRAETAAVRPPGEVGGHTVQPAEQPESGVAIKNNPSSQDTPTPEESSSETPTGGALDTAEIEGKVAPSGPSEGGGATRPNRGVRPRQGPEQRHAAAHEAALTQGPATQGSTTQGHASHAPDRLVLAQALTQALGENLAKAMHQTVMQALDAAWPARATEAPSPDPSAPAASAPTPSPAQQGPPNPAAPGPSRAIHAAGNPNPAAAPPIRTDPPGGAPNTPRPSAPLARGGPGGATRAGAQPQEALGATGAEGPAPPRAGVDSDLGRDAEHGGASSYYGRVH